MMWANHTSRVEEADNHKAAENPAWEADPEGLDVLDEALFRRKVGIWLISDRIDAVLTLKFFSQILSIILNYIVVPGNI